MNPFKILTFVFGIFTLVLFFLIATEGVGAIAQKFDILSERTVYNLLLVLEIGFALSLIFSFVLHHYEDKRTPEQKKADLAATIERFNNAIHSEKHC